jgi:hypothetical protein
MLFHLVSIDSRAISVHFQMPFFFWWRAVCMFILGGIPVAGGHLECIFSCSGALREQDVYSFMWAGTPREQDLHIFTVFACLAGTVRLGAGF